MAPSLSQKPGAMRRPVSAAHTSNRSPNAAPAQQPCPARDRSSEPRLGRARPSRARAPEPAVPSRSDSMNLPPPAEFTPSPYAPLGAQKAAFSAWRKRRASSGGSNSRAHGACSPIDANGALQLGKPRQHVDEKGRARQKLCSTRTGGTVAPVRKHGRVRPQQTDPGRQRRVLSRDRLRCSATTAP